MFTILRARDRVVQPAPTWFWYVTVSLFLAVCCVIAVTYTLWLPWNYTLFIGQANDQPFIKGFHGREQNNTETFRWTKQNAQLVFPSLGTRATIRLRLTGKQPDDPIEIGTANHHVRVPLHLGWQNLTLHVAPDPWTGTVKLALHTTPGHLANDDPRDLGIVLNQVDVRGGGGPVAPLPGLLAGWCVFLCGLATMFFSRRLLPGIVAGVASAALLVAGLAVDGGAMRPLVAAYLWPLAAALTCAVIVAWLVRAVLLWAIRTNRLHASPNTAHMLALAALLVCFVRASAFAFPLANPIDLPFYIQRATAVRDGQVMSLFLPNTALTPTQWAVDGPVPRSPLFYILTSPLMNLPGSAGSLSLMLVSSMLETLGALLVALIVWYATRNTWSGVFAALLYALHPLGIRLLLGWGTFSTFFAQTLALLAVVLWLYLRPTLQRRAAQLWLGLAFAAAYLAYPTGVMFLGVTWVLLVMLLVIQRDRAAVPTLIAGLYGAGIAVVLYYGWHVQAAVTKTLPALLSTTSSAADSITMRELFDAIWLPLRTHQGDAALALAGLGYLLLISRLPGGRARAATTAISAWALTYLPMAFVNGYVVTLILKHMAYGLPVVAAGGGIVLGSLAQRGSGGKIVAWVCIGLAAVGALATEYAIVVT